MGREGKGGKEKEKKKKENSAEKSVKNTGTFPNEPDKKITES